MSTSGIGMRNRALVCGIEIYYSCVVNQYTQHRTKTWAQIINLKTTHLSNIPRGVGRQPKVEEWVTG